MAKYGESHSGMKVIVKQTIFQHISLFQPYFNHIFVNETGPIFGEFLPMRQIPCPSTRQRCRLGTPRWLGDGWGRLDVEKPPHFAGRSLGILEYNPRLCSNLTWFFHLLIQDDNLQPS